MQRSKTDGSKPPNNTDKPNGIIVKFAQYNTGDKAYRAKKLFKRTIAKIHILEKLNTKRMKPLDEPHKNTRTSLQQLLTNSTQQHGNNKLQFFSYRISG